VSAWGGWLKDEIRKQNAKVAELSEKSGVSSSTFYKIMAGGVANPAPEIRDKIEGALGCSPSIELLEDISQQTRIPGFDGVFLSFDPHNNEDTYEGSAVYIIYDITKRPVYIGEGGSLRKRMKDHNSGHSRKWWWSKPIVEHGAYLQVGGRDERQKIEKLLIKFLGNNALFNIKDVRRTD